MPYNGSGTFSLTYDWTTEQASSPIEISKLDEQEADIAAGLSNCILRDGTGVPTSATPWNSQNLTGVGSLTAVSGTFSGAVTATSLVPSSSTVPANGLYLPAANTVGIASNTALRGSVNSTGNWVFAAPSSGTALTVSGPDSAVIAAFLDTTSTSGVYMRMGDSVGSRGYMGFGSSTFSGAAISDFGIAAASGVLRFSANGGTNTHMQIANAGNVTINAPSSGTAVTVNGLAGQIGLQVAGDYQGNWPIEVTSTGGATTGRVAISFVRQGGTNKQWALGNNPDGASDNTFGIRDITRGAMPFQISTNGNVTINAPSSGTALAVASASGARGVSVSEASVPKIALDTGGGERAYFQYTEGTSTARIDSDGILEFASNNTSRVSIASAGNVTINAASSGDELTVTGSVVATSFAGALTGNVTGDVTGNVSGSSGSTTGNAATATALQTARTINGTSFNGTANITVTASADTLTGSTLPALSGVNLTALNASNLASGTVAAARIGSSTDYAIGDGSTVNSIQIGFRGIPQNAQTGNYTCVLTDAGKHIYHASGAGAGDTYTIPANGSVAYAIGTAITFINRATDAVSIAITTDTLTQAGTGATGTRALAAYGVATAIKITSTEWIISGTGLT